MNESPDTRRHLTTLCETSRKDMQKIIEYNKIIQLNTHFNTFPANFSLIILASH